MAHKTLEYIRGLRSSLAQKKAEITGQDPDTIPGAEHNSPVAEEYKKPDQETRDGTMVPNSGLNTDGAGDDSPITHTNDLEADEAALTPKKEPEITADANAKTAEKLAAEILTDICDWEKKQASAAKKAEEDTTPPKSDATSEELVTDKGGKEPEQIAESTPPKKEPEITPDADAEPGSDAAGETAEAAKTAGVFDLELTSDVLAKIAAVILATDEGTQFAEKALSKVAGAEAAEKTLDFLRVQSAYAEGQRQAISDLSKRAECDGDCDSPDEIVDSPEIQQVADAIDQLVESGEITEDEADQLVQDIAAAAAEDRGDSDEAEKTAEAIYGAGQMDVIMKLAQAIGADPNELAAAVAAQPDPAAAEAQMNEQIAVPPEQFDPNSVPQGDAGDITPDDVADAIDQLVESGEITEDEADQLVQEIVGDAGQQAQGGDAEVSPEDVATALQAAVESGELSPEDVQEVLSELEGVPAPEEAPQQAAPDATPVDPAAEAPAADAAAVAPTDEAKTAAATLLNAIRAARHAKK